MPESSFPLALLIIPLALVLTLAGLYLLGRYYQQKTEAGLARQRGLWRRFETETNRVLLEARDVLEDAEEPFLSLARRLHGALDALERLSMPLREQRVTLRQRANDLNANPFRAIIAAPYLWHHLNRDVEQWESDLVQAQAALDSADQVENELAEIGWTWAEHARQTRDLQRQVTEAHNGLRARHLQGDALDAAVKELHSLRQTLKRLPGYFYDAERADVLAQANREDIVLVYGMVQDAYPALERLLAQAQDWDQQAQAAAERVTALQRSLADLETTLGSLPQAIDAAPANQLLDGTRQIANTMQRTLDSLEVDSAGLLTEQAATQTRSIQETNLGLKKARRDLSALESTLDELPGNFKDLSLRMATLGGKSIHPVQLTHSLDELAQLNRRANTLGSAGRKRTPEAVSADLGVAAEVRAQQKALSARLSELEIAHAALSELLSRPPLDGLEDWLGRARSLAADIAAYGADNWSRADAANDLPAEIDRLASAARGLNLTTPGEAIGEQQVSAWLDNARSLADLAVTLQKRLDNSRARLSELQAQEAQALEILRAALAELGRIELIARSNELLTALAAQEMGRLQRDLSSLQDEFSQRQQGSVERKARQVEQVLARLETGANTWLTQINEDTREVLKETSAVLSELEPIAPLQEAAIDRAHAVLEEAPAQGASGRAQRTRFAWTELTDRLGQAAEYWTECVATLQALGDFQPLLETYAAANDYRGQARQMYSEVKSLRRKKGAWPPSTVSLDAEQQELDKLEAEWKRLQDTPTRAIARVQQLGNLAARYQALMARIGAAIERAEREDSEVDELERSIDEQAGYWKELYQQYQDYPAATEDISDLLNSVPREHESIRRKYISGSLDYEATLQELKRLQKRLAYFKAAVDDDSSVDVRGNITRRRESRRIN